jgi:hypothetical protein
MSNTETINNDQWSTRELTESQRENRRSAELIPFGEHGVSPENFAQVVDMAKMMSTARGAVPAHLVGNTGACLAVIELGQKFQMSAYMLAMGCFSVNGMLAFTGQTIMGIMNRHMPLAKTEDGKRTRLKYTFEGEHAEWKPEEVDVLDRDDRPTGKKVWINKLIKPSTRVIIVTGRMEGEADDLVYRSPPVFKINNKNSPLWQEDEDQQLIYWASKRWQRRWWPEGMLGIYDNEELVERNYGAANAKLIQNDDDPGKRLIERIAAAKAEGTEQREGFTVEHAHNETQGQPAKADTPAAFSSEASSEPAVDAGAKAEVAEPAKTKKKKGAKDAEAPAAHQVEQVTGEPDHEVMPTNGTEWEVYAKVWIAALAANPNATKDDYNKRWKAETTLRNDCGITAEVRDRVYDMLLASRDDAKK